MWKPATRQLTGTNDVPLGNRRRFGPAPTEDTPAPQLAQPSPSAYPRPRDQDDGQKRGRDDSPVNGDTKSKPLMLKQPDILRLCCTAQGLVEN
ncbi:hypothetical protein CPB83DRAFT_628023 [Crepidotus variabilis]|uniref:Uncharacterized protein n=1 Tax=Crepidotus variabilis TaxID=179855 RepID=A0A9P6JUK9_9AGAR|nr:hypothetical protein CPB83DRAFT_628023 [Crepidotus variabilis]